MKKQWVLNNGGNEQRIGEIEMKLDEMIERRKIKVVNITNAPRQTSTVCVKSTEGKAWLPLSCGSGVLIIPLAWVKV